MPYVCLIVAQYTEVGVGAVAMEGMMNRDGLGNGKTVDEL